MSVLMTNFLTFGRDYSMASLAVVKIEILRTRLTLRMEGLNWLLTGPSQKSRTRYHVNRINIFAIVFLLADVIFVMLLTENAPATQRPWGFVPVLPNCICGAPPVWPTDSEQFDQLRLAKWKGLPDRGMDFLPVYKQRTPTPTLLACHVFTGCRRP